MLRSVACCAPRLSTTPYFSCTSGVIRSAGRDEHFRKPPLPPSLSLPSPPRPAATHRRASACRCPWRRPTASSSCWPPAGRRGTGQTPKRRPRMQLTSSTRGGGACARARPHGRLRGARQGAQHASAEVRRRGSAAHHSTAHHSTAQRNAGGCSSLRDTGCCRTATLRRPALPSPFLLQLTAGPRAPWRSVGPMPYPRVSRLDWQCGRTVFVPLQRHPSLLHAWQPRVSKSNCVVDQNSF